MKRSKSTTILSDKLDLNTSIQSLLSDGYDVQLTINVKQPNEHVNVNELAELWRMTPSNIRRMIANKTLPIIIYRKGKRLYFDREEAIQCFTEGLLTD